MPDSRRRVRRLLVWFALNLIIFVACYLNYRLQLKHRYLYKTLNVGLCFSRAAAMVINFNLLLVWLPMCKYSLTRLGYFGSGSLQIHKQKHLELVNSSIDHQLIDYNKTSKLSQLKRKFNDALVKLHIWFLRIKIDGIKTLLVAIDHCKYLHTICATTITIASVIHTVAHLINVINFSNNFDPLLSNLNMAEYKGQNPLQLLISVPGITGCLMIIILILMSLSSVDFIRNSSYDLFQIFHRLSIVFVVLLFLHPSSHVLKEQSNVSRHNPDVCSLNVTTRTVNFSNNSTQAVNYALKAAIINEQLNVPLALRNANGAPKSSLNDSLKLSEQNNQISLLANSQALELLNANNSKSHQAALLATTHKTSDLNNKSSSHQVEKTESSPPTRTDQLSRTAKRPAERLKRNSSQKAFQNNRPNRLSLLNNNTTSLEATSSEDNNYTDQCLDPVPLFVAQSSICWYVVGAGLSCYLIDLLLRRCRRSKSSIELLDVRMDSEGNLIELILNSNHKRFARWLPGQFVYLNCPQITQYEWHPFTISSMDNDKRQFTLHIKTGGDWTRKLREKLESILLKNSMSPPSITTSSINTTDNTSIVFGSSKGNLANNLQLSDIPILPDSECYNKRTGELLVECTKLVKIAYEYENKGYEDEDNGENETYCCQRDCCQQQQQPPSFYSICSRLEQPARLDKCDHSNGHNTTLKELNLFIDGPFHSPFERLLEQQVSVCIANGVGWTAFSSVFQCILNKTISNKLSNKLENQKDWWSKWRNFAVSRVQDKNQSFPQCDDESTSNDRKSVQTNLHLLVVVTSVEQLEPFYYLAIDYFNKIGRLHNLGKSNDKRLNLNPVREITAFITRFSETDDSVKDFCARENLLLLNKDRLIRVNDMFRIYFGKPNFDIYLNSFTARYSDSPKISVYCCGSYQVKNSVQEICKNLNKTAKKTFTKKRPIYSYHEENF